jgi:GAF domain-containing protein
MAIDELIGELEEMIGESADFDTILETAVERLHETEPHYDWTGIYELFPDNTLRLGPFIGSPTDHAFIGVGQGVCGTAVAEKRNINVPDVRKVSNYLACSADTRSELVVLIRDQERIYGQIDIDSHQVAAFDERGVEDVQRVADVLAKAYERRHIASS